jgi:DNA processing protein
VAYPAEHAALFDDVAARGAIVSEFPPGTPPRPGHFPVRNRLLAGWGVAVVVVEAAARSGTLITARLALEGDRAVLAVPGPVTSELSAGTNTLIREGAVLVRDLADVLAELPSGLVRPLPSGDRDRRPSRPRDPVLAAIPDGDDADLDALEERTGLAPGQLLGRLAALEVAGLVERRPGGRWMRR